MCWLESLGFVTGLVLILKSIYNLSHFVYVNFLGRFIGHGLNISKCGPWAVVTGATDGIGKSYARLLAAKGLNVVLVSRTPAKLQKVADEIKSEYGSIEIKTIAVDFTDGNSIYSKLEAELSQFEIGILINNVGMAVGFAESFADIADEKSLNDIVNCNILSMVRMSRLVLPQMIKRKKGVIVNIGSISGAFATPFATVYGATKAFVDKFSCDLSSEVKESGVIVQTVHPGFVVTNMSKLRKATWKAPTPDRFVAAALSTLGLTNRTSGFWFHSIQLYWGELAKFIFPESMAFFTIKFMKSHRQRVLNRQSNSK
ncbi:very-long-chain 3-oxoacyl-CoA reductase-B-like [Daphnia carinata]|uniref:very-long-chain 3-oxoacyl-CoA reductase-B-like n=1 Tax=Daphnia carinata TaxID=120202 RepID=UPI00257F0327|nr:very-long-chain 3-oxoacyl-CoA reductase-B-like [Daphnia carinata]